MTAIKYLPDADGRKYDAQFKVVFDENAMKTGAVLADGHFLRSNAGDTGDGIRRVAQAMAPVLPSEIVRWTRGLPFADVRAADAAAERFADTRQWPAMSNEVLAQMHLRLDAAIDLCRGMLQLQKPPMPFPPNEACARCWCITGTAEGRSGWNGVTAGRRRCPRRTRNRTDRNCTRALLMFCRCFALHGFLLSFHCHAAGGR